jgi:hypothetical protein
MKRGNLERLRGDRFCGWTGAAQAVSSSKFRCPPGSNCPLAGIRALAACTFKARAFTGFALFNHLIRAGAAVAGYADPEAADFAVKIAPEYIGVDRSAPVCVISRTPTSNVK